MSTVSNLSVLLKVQDRSGNSIYEDELRNLGIEPVTIAALSFQYINQDKLLRCLQCASDYCGLILTSQRVVESMILSLNHCPEDEKEQILSQWRDKSNFTVGEATKNAATSLLQIKCCGETSGSAEALVPIILERRDTSSIQAPSLSMQ